MSVRAIEVKALIHPVPAASSWFVARNSSFSSEVKRKVANHSVCVCVWGGAVERDTKGITDLAPYL